MKKIILFMLAIVAATFTFTACEDVPEPYPIPPTDSGGQGGNETPTTIGTAENPITVASALTMINDLADNATSSEEAYVKGIVVKVSTNASQFDQYGNINYYISDDGKDENTIYVYGGNGLNGDFFKAVTDIKAGDEVIVVGKLQKYINNNTGKMTPEIAKGNYLVKLTQGTPQPGGEAKGTGTLEDPFNAAAANAYASSLADDAESDKDIYIKGKIIDIEEKNQFNAQYGNCTFYISDDGTDTSDKFYVFRTLYLGNVKYTEGELPKKGDEVIICGKVVNYRGNTPETAANKSYIYSLNGKTGGGDTPQPGGEAKGSGTLEDPYNAAAANAFASSLAADAESDKDIYIKGKIIDIEEKNQFNTQYGNCTFYISDDGTDTTDKFYVFRTLYLGNVKYTEGELPKKGDEVIICGKVVNYKGNTPETAANKSYIYSLNGKTESGGGDTPGTVPGKPSGNGTLESPYNATAANAFASSLAADTKSDKDIYIKGKIIDIEEKNQFSTQYGNCTFYISDDGTDASEKFYVFRTLYLGNVKYTDGVLPKKGDEVIICGKVTNYKGNTPETVANESYIYSLNGKTEADNGGGDTPGPGTGGDDTGDGYVITMADFGLENAADVPTLTAGDGTTLTFAQEGGKNAPKYYTAAGGSVRMYALNSLTIKSSKTITKVVITTSDPYQGTAYNGNDQMYGEAGGNKVETKKDSDTQVSFTGFSSNELKIVNDFTGNSGGTQLRVAKVTITYAK